MGLFKNNPVKLEASALKMIEGKLVPRDGGLHVLMLTTMADYHVGVSYCEEIYTTQINAILDEMQRMGYTILNVQFAPMIVDQNVTNPNYSTLISYK